MIKSWVQYRDLWLAACLLCPFLLLQNKLLQHKQAIYLSYMVSHGFADVNMCS
jgi:hypothetical protein